MPLSDHIFNFVEMKEINFFKKSQIYLVEPWVATPPPPLVAVEVEVVGPYLGLTILINK